MSCLCTGRCRTWPYNCSGVPDPFQQPSPFQYGVGYGCICPPGSERTCQGPLCPRRPISVSGIAANAADPTSPTDQADNAPKRETNEPGL